MEEMGSERASVAAIGQAGENLFGPAMILTDRSGAGSLGSIMGSKNLKAVGVVGSGSVKVACTEKELLDIIAYHSSLIGGNSGSMTPKFPQPWAEFYGGSWTNAKDVFWGGADPPVQTGACDPHDVHSIALRGPGTRWPWTTPDMQYTMVRGASCFGCPQPCNQAVHFPKWRRSTERPRTSVTSAAASVQPVTTTARIPVTKPPCRKPSADDYGLGDDYHYATGDFCYIVDQHPEILQAMLPEAEYKAINWAARKNGDPQFIADLRYRFAYRVGELGTAFGLGSYELNKRWKFPPMAQQWQERGVEGGRLEHYNMVRTAPL